MGWQHLLVYDINKGNKVNIHFSEVLNCYVLLSGCYMYEGTTFGKLMENYVNGYEHGNNLVG